MAGTTDTVPARLTPGEFVIKRESAEMLGMPFLEKLNSVSDGAAHSNIDSLIAEATLSQMMPMTNGGSVGNENIAGYENGGKVPGYQDGGDVIHNRVATRKEQEAGMKGGFDEHIKPLFYFLNYQDYVDKPYKEMNAQERNDFFTSQIFKEQFNKLTKGTLKGDTPVQRYLDFPAMDKWHTAPGGENPYLDSLDYKLGDWYEAGDPETGALSEKEAEDFLLHMMEIYQTPEYKKARRSGNKGVSGYQDGDQVSPEMYTSMVRKLIGKLGGEEPEGMYTPEGGMSRAGYAKMLGADPESIAIDTLSFQNPANYRFKVSGKGAQSGADVGGTTSSMGMLPLKSNVLDPLMREKIEDPFERMDMDMLFSKIAPQGYQEGDVVQDDAMMQQFLQQQQMQQQQPQQQGQQQPSIAPPGAAAGQTMSWGEPGAYMNSLTATRDSLYQAAEQAKIDSANQSLEAIKLDSLIQSLIQSLGKEGERIERTPEDSNFYKNTPDQDAWLQKHKNNIAAPFFNR